MEQTALHPLVALAFLVAGLCICSLPRKQVVLPFLFAAFLIPADQVVLIDPFHFMTMRILVLFGLLRVLWAKGISKQAILAGGVNRLDVAILAFAASSAIAGLLLWHDWKAVVFQSGELYSVVGVYVVLRFLIREKEDVERTLKAFAWLATVIAVIMLYEQAKGWNPYALLGGSHAQEFATLSERGDRFRATGPFAHPILAGTFGAISMPLFFALWWKERRDRAVAALGMIAAVMISFASNSSTPLLALIGGLAALCCWPLRKFMGVIRWGIVVVLIALHIVMKAPVWSLISRVDLVGGSSSYHRYQLVDAFIRHFGDWCLVGVKGTADWGWDMWDLSNQYVLVGETSGLVPFLLFITIIVLAFKYAGRARRMAACRRDQLFIWAIGCALFANVVAFFGISYFDQTIVAWYALLAMIVAVRRSSLAISSQNPGWRTAVSKPPLVSDEEFQPASLACSD